MGIPDHLTCLLRNLYAGPEATVKLDMEQHIGSKSGRNMSRTSGILSPCLFNLNGEYIMRNAGLDEAQTGVKFAGRNINNLRYADDTNLMAESEEELKSLLMKVKEESEKVGSALTTSWQIQGETVTDFILGSSKITADGDCSHEKKDTCFLEEKL